jgi:hypothetical protein
VHCLEVMVCTCGTRDSTEQVQGAFFLCRQPACNYMQRDQQGPQTHHKHSNCRHTMGSSALSHISSNHSREHSTSSSQTCNVSLSNSSRCRSMHDQTRIHACNNSSIRTCTCR